MPELKHEHSVMIDASPQEVYQYVSDFQRHTEWNYQPQEITRVSEGPEGVGSVYHTTEKMPDDLSWLMRKVFSPLFMMIMGSKDYTAAEITAMEPGKRFAWKSWQPLRGGDRALEVDWELLLEPENGSTHLTQRCHWIPKHSMSDPTMLEDSVKNGMAKNLNHLKEILEG